jgi:hypothetical protein
MMTFQNSINSSKGEHLLPFGAEPGLFVTGLLKMISNCKKYSDPVKNVSIFFYMFMIQNQFIKCQMKTAEMFNSPIRAVF